MRIQRPTHTHLPPAPEYPTPPVIPTPEDQKQTEEPRRAGGLKRWTDREQMMVYLVLAGHKSQYIADKLGLGLRRVQAIRSSPLFHSKLRSARAELKSRTMGDFIERISSEAIPNFEFFVEMRDNPDYHNEDSRARIQAARSISTEVDRVYPRVTKHEEERSVKISFDQKMLQQMAAALREDDNEMPTIDVTPPHSDQPLLAPSQVDDYMAALESEIEDAGPS